MMAEQGRNMLLN